MIERVAEVLLAAFASHPFAWSTKTSALAEVRKSLQPDHLSLAMLSDDGSPLGWIGGIAGYQGHTWELHPLAVSPAHQRRGIGRALVGQLEARVRERGGRNLWLTTDDSTGSTTLFDTDLYPDVLTHLAGLVSNGHPIDFYRHLGFIVTGAIPDAYGPGRHEYVMAKRLS